MKETDHAPPAPPRGLFVCRGPKPTPAREVDFDFVDGWLVRPGWNLVEPSEGQYDWSYIENEIALAKQLKKKIALTVLGGPRTPDWVYRAGAKEFSFTMPTAYSQETRIPVLWDKVYLAKWTALVRALGARFADDETVVLVHITGATRNGLEMHLPFRPKETKQWHRLGYSPDKAVTAWKQIVDAFAEAFPRTPLDIDIHPVLGSDSVAKEVAEYGERNLGKRFGIYGGWLSGKSAVQDQHHAGMHALAQEYGRQSFADFQMIAGQTLTPDDFAAGGVKAAIEQGMGWGARYFEVWEVDVMDPRMQPTLRALAKRIKAQ